jgi:hypothetical protein
MHRKMNGADKKKLGAKIFLNCGFNGDWGNIKTASRRRGETVRPD